MPLFEVHVSVDISEPFTELKWLSFCDKNGYHKIRVLNTTGKHNIQNMTGFYITQENDKRAIQFVENFSEIVREAGFKILRVKVESMMGSDSNRDIILTGETGKYWEFHIKIKNKKVYDMVDLENILKTIDLESYETIGLSFSVYGKSETPIITLRSYKGDRELSKKFLEKVLSRLQVSEESLKIQYEFSIYDTILDLDEGWNI